MTPLTGSSRRLVYIINHIQLHVDQNKDDTMPEAKEFKIKVKHTFKHTRKTLVCREALYVSDYRQESHYRKGHANNKS
jgi:hypothetical protein